MLFRSVNMQNLTITQYNKGPSYFENVLGPMESFLEESAPSIAMLSEANYDDNLPLNIDKTCFPQLSQYNIEGSLIQPGSSFIRSRTVSLIRKELKYIRRTDLEVQGLQTVIIELSVSKFKKIFVIGWYRQ